MANDLSRYYTADDLYPNLVWRLKEYQDMARRNGQLPPDEPPILDTIPDSDTDTRPMDAASITEALRKSK